MQKPRVSRIEEYHDEYRDDENAPELHAFAAPPVWLVWIHDHILEDVCRRFVRHVPASCSCHHSVECRAGSGAANFVHHPQAAGMARM